MQIVIDILNKVKVKHETFLTKSEEPLNTTGNIHYPKWMQIYLQNKRESSKEILKETNEAIAVLSAYKLTKNQIENKITKQDGI